MSHNQFNCRNTYDDVEALPSRNSAKVMLQLNFTYIMFYYKYLEKKFKDYFSHKVNRSEFN